MVKSPSLRPGRFLRLGCFVFAALVFGSCPLMLPSGGVEIVASPELYLPIELPADFKIDFDLGRLAAISSGDLSGDFAVYDYPGGYPDTVAFIAVKKLFEEDLRDELNAALNSLPPYFPPSLIDRQPVPLYVPNTGSQNLDVSSLMAPLDGYPLDFRTVNVYLFVDGPPALFAGNAVTVTTLTANGTSLLTGQPVGRVPLPALPASGAPLEKPLRPAPAPVSLAAVFNARPSAVALSYDIAINGSLSIGDLRRNPAVSAYLVLEMPLEFVITSDFPIPVNASPPETKISISDGVFADAGADEIIRRLEHLTLETAIKNNLGLAGFVAVNTGDYGPGAAPLGRINLDGASTVRFTKTTIEDNRPFPLWAEIVLEAGQFINIKRQNDPAHTSPVEMSLAVRVKTSLHERF
ncbi:MAG: hypothetical protein LBC88_09645 [Spirochaetaceae bacterium]|jgi:hypothetical protein|nr:hypothetical protein [Spirochaetaceae bacterium]